MRLAAYGLIPVVTTDAESGELLMHGHMNAESLRRTIRLGEAVYWSRSRQTLWHKGATSGLTQKVVELRIDDDQDALWLRVEVKGGASCQSQEPPNASPPNSNTARKLSVSISLSLGPTSSVRYQKSK